MVFQKFFLSNMLHIPTSHNHFGKPKKCKCNKNSSGGCDCLSKLGPWHVIKYNGLHHKTWRKKYFINYLMDYSLSLMSTSNIFLRYLNHFQLISLQKLGRNNEEHEKKLFHQLLDGLLLVFVVDGDFFQLKSSYAVSKML